MTRLLGMGLYAAAGLVLGVSAGLPALAGAPGMGSQPERQPDFIEHGPKPAHPRHDLQRDIRGDADCPAPGRLFVANSAQDYALSVRLSRRQAPDGGLRIFKAVLAPGAKAVAVGCAGAPNTPSYWHLDNARFVAASRGH